MRALPPQNSSSTSIFDREALVKAFRITCKGLALAWKSSPPLGVALMALTAISAALPPAIAYVGKLIIDAIVARQTEQTIWLVAGEFGLIALSTIVMRTLFLVRVILGNKLGIDVNTLILRKAVALDLSQIENSEYYDKLTRARQEASSRSLQLVSEAFMFVQNALTLAGYVALLLNFSGWAVLALVIASLPATIAEMRFSSIGFKLYNWRSTDRRRLAYLEQVLSGDAYAKELRIFGLAPSFLGRYQSLAARFFAEDKALASRRTIWVILLSMLSSAAFYGCYVAIAIQAAMGRISLGDLTLYVVVFRQGQQAFQSCLAGIGSTYEHNLYLSNLFEFLAIPKAELPARQSSTADDRLSPGAEGRPKQILREGIYFDNLSFKYPGRAEFALKNITLSIPRGQSVAVVGSNGAGKSTLIKLLCRLYHPTSGRIFLDGRDLEDWNRDELLSRVSVVFQDFNKYMLSLRENVGVGQISHLDDESQVRRAVERGGASSLLKELSSGLDTSLGSWFYGGRELSGGQWQKVAVARAFMRENADIMILDEPTAALDAEAEAQAFQQFRELTVGKTSLIISHRFPVARLADHIVVIEKGQIQEEGAHEGLIRANGRYANLFALQAKGYE